MPLPRSRRTVALLAALAFFGAPTAPARAASPVDDVNVFVGTGGHGHTFPAATVPFGFVQVGPDTRDKTWDGCSGYYYADTTISGFSHLHLSGTGVGDLGDVLLMPITGDLQDAGGYRPLDCERFKSGFSHDHETASPGYYSVDLDRYRVHAELAATAHAGLHRYTFPADAVGHVLLDLGHGIDNKVAASTLTVESDRRVSGSHTTRGWAWNRKTYFAVVASRPWTGVSLEADDRPLAGTDTTATGKKARAAFEFKPGGGPLLIRVGLSAVSAEAARRNLDAEMPTADFDVVRTAARQQWDEHLSRLSVQSPDPAVRRTFYSALYHTLLAPTLYNDADGAYRGRDGKVHADEGFVNYSTMSLWDTFRAEHPLLTLVTPERVTDFVRTALASYAQSPKHELPMWPLAADETHCMIGYHAVPVILDAYSKGFRGFDVGVALQAMQETALHSGNCPDDYDTLGYVAARTGKRLQAAARTLEYAFDDACIARMAQALNQKDVADRFGRRAAYYGNLFDRGTGFFRARDADGAWHAPFDPKAIDFDHYTEANAWQYAFFVPQDVPALIRLHGGREAFVGKLDECFGQESDIHKHLIDVSGLIGQYSHGNEPCHHMPYLYALAGAQDKTARLVRQIMRTQYDDTPEGLCGNDDCGQMSAWYVWSAMGLYPLNPVDGRYVIGSPAVTSATLRLDPKFAAGQSFTVVAHDNSPQNLYVKSAKLNGKPLDRPWVTHAEVTAGGTLELEMGVLPGRLWATATP